MSKLYMPRPVRLVLLALIFGFLTLLAAAGMMVSRAQAGSCLRLGAVLAEVNGTGRVKEGPVLLRGNGITGTYMVVIFDDGSAALAQFLPNDGCMVRAMPGTEKQARAVIAAARLKGA